MTAVAGRWSPPLVARMPSFRWTCAMLFADIGKVFVKLRVFSYTPDGSAGGSDCQASRGESPSWMIGDRSRQRGSRIDRASSRPRCVD